MKRRSIKQVNTSSTTTSLELGSHFETTTNNSSQRTLATKSRLFKGNPSDTAKNSNRQSFKKDANHIMNAQSSKIMLNNGGMKKFGSGTQSDEGKIQIIANGICLPQAADYPMQQHYSHTSLPSPHSRSSNNASKLNQKPFENHNRLETVARQSRES